jgi:hypothetical protein
VIEQLPPAGNVERQVSSVMTNAAGGVVCNVIPVTDSEPPLIRLNTVLEPGWRAQPLKLAIPGASVTPAGVAVAVGVGVEEDVALGEPVGVEVPVGVPVGVPVAVPVGVPVGVGVTLLDDVGLEVDVGVAVGVDSPCQRHKDCACQRPV